MYFDNPRYICSASACRTNSPEARNLSAFATLDLSLNKLNNESRGSSHSGVEYYCRKRAPGRFLEGCLIRKLPTYTRFFDFLLEDKCTVDFTTQRPRRFPRHGCGKRQRMDISEGPGRCGKNSWSSMFQSTTKKTHPTLAKQAIPKGPYESQDI